MADLKALTVAFDNSDRMFFEQHRDRQARIRLPHAGECDGEFWSLGEHNRARRRIILWKVPEDNPFQQRMKQPILKIPFLAYADETIEDTDDVLMPVIHEIMLQAKDNPR